ncbi:EpsG family protein [Vagococcus fluvialis]|uniref:EpsG family protein n=1 Tax=Vagococcus fluvialis TaxID=2738 RepID=UPI00379123C7
MIRNNKIVNEFSYLSVLIIMWIVGAFSTNNPDIKNYQLVYDYLSISNTVFYTDFEKGFSLLMKICTMLGFNYQGFLILIATIELFLLNRLVKKLSVNPILVLILFLFFPFFLEVVQIRNFLSFLIVANSAIFLLEGKNIKFIIGIMIASLFHISSLFYLTFLLVYLSKEKLLYLIISTTSIFLLLKQKLFLLFISVLPNGERYLAYTNPSKKTTILLFIVFFFVNYILIKELKKSAYALDNKYNHLTCIQKNSLEFIEKINIIIVISFIFISIDINFFRLYRNVILFNYILYSNTFFKGRIISNKNAIIIQAAYFMFSIFVGIVFLYSTQTTTVVKTILESIKIF